MVILNHQTTNHGENNLNFYRLKYYFSVYKILSFKNCIFIVIHLLTDLRQFPRAPVAKVASVLHRVHRPSSLDTDHHQRHYRRVHLSGHKKHCFNPLTISRVKDVTNSW